VYKHACYLRITEEREKQKHSLLTERHTESIAVAREKMFSKFSTATYSP
jgi:hypothetical protein